MMNFIKESLSTQSGQLSTAALFAAIGTRYGAGDGSTTFNLPESPGGGWELSPGAEIYMRQDGEVTP